MRIQRKTKRGTVYQASFRGRPSKEAVLALDAIADAAVKTMQAPAVTLAWRVDINCWMGIVAAATEPAARWRAVAAYRDIGYGQKGVWPSVTAHRAPEYDNHPELIRQPKIMHNESNLR